MQNLLDKLNTLRGTMEKYGIFQQDDEVGLALIEVEAEIKSLAQWTIYDEDFDSGSPEHEHLFKFGEVKDITVLYKK